MRIYGKYLLISFAWGICFSLSAFTNVGPAYPLEALVINIGLEGFNACNQITMINLLERMVPYYIFIILFGTYIYRHFCWCSPYIFSRCEKRKGWLYKEMGKLLGFSFMYILIMVIGRMIPFIIARKLTVNKTGIIMLLLLLGIMTIWLFSSALLCNLLSIWKGSIWGTVCTLTTQTVSVLSMIFINSEEWTNTEILKLRLNYSAHLVFAWHSLGEKDIEGMNQLGVNLSFVESYLYLLIIALVIIIVSVYFIEKKDIILNMEEQ